MAWLYQDPLSQNCKVCFRFGGRSYKKSLKTTSRDDAEIILGGVRRTLLRLEQNLRELPPHADILAFVLSDGKHAEKPSRPQTVTLQDLIDRYTSVCSVGAMEENSLETTKMHLRHFVATFGKGFAVGGLKLADLQRHVERRAKKHGIRKRLLSPTTIRKEVASLRAAWNWGVQAGLVTGPFPHRGLMFPKTSEKPPFQTWEEIERQIERGGLGMTGNYTHTRPKRGGGRSSRRCAAGRRRCGTRRIGAAEDAWGSRVSRCRRMRATSGVDVQRRQATMLVSTARMASWRHGAALHHPGRRRRHPDRPHLVAHRRPPPSTSPAAAVNQATVAADAGGAKVLPRAPPSRAAGHDGVREGTPPRRGERAGQGVARVRRARQRDAPRFHGSRFGDGRGAACDRTGRPKPPAAGNAGAGPLQGQRVGVGRRADFAGPGRPVRRGRVEGEDRRSSGLTPHAEAQKFAGRHRDERLPRRPAKLQRAHPLTIWWVARFQAMPPRDVIGDPEMDRKQAGV